MILLFFLINISIQQWKNHSQWKIFEFSCRTNKFYLVRVLRFQMINKHIILIPEQHRNENRFGRGGVCEEKRNKNRDWKEEDLALSPNMLFGCGGCSPKRQTNITINLPESLFMLRVKRYFPFRSVLRRCAWIIRGGFRGDEIDDREVQSTRSATSVFPRAFQTFRWWKLSVGLSILYFFFNVFEKVFKFSFYDMYWVNVELFWSIN